jgi:hypothetical protein
MSTYYLLIASPSLVRSKSDIESHPSRNLKIGALAGVPAITSCVVVLVALMHKRLKDQQCFAPVGVVMQQQL